MASLSTYASRFLSLGTSNQHDSQSRSQYNDDSDPLFRSHFDDTEQDPNASSLSSSDGLPTLQSTTRNQSNRSDRNPMGSNSLAGMSRYSSYGAYGGGNGGYSIYANQNPISHQSKRKTGGGGGSGMNVTSSRMMSDSIREIDDEDDVDLWRNQRRMAGRIGLDDKRDDDSYDEEEGLQPSDYDDDDDDDHEGKHSKRGNQIQNASSQVSDGNGSVDPFLAEDDLQRGETSKSKSKSRKRSQLSKRINLNDPRIHTSKIKRHTSTKKGWLAHGDESSVISEEESPSTSNRNPRNVLFDSYSETRNESEASASKSEERERGRYSLEDDGSETSRDEITSKSKSRTRHKGKGRAFDANEEDTTVSITLSPDHSRVNASRSGRRVRASSISSSTSSNSSRDLDPEIGTRSIIRLDSYNLPLIPSGDSWAPWPWYLFKLPHFIQSALDDRIWERNQEEIDEEWGDSRGNRSRRRRRTGIEEDEHDFGIKPPGWKEWNDKKAVITFCVALTCVFVFGGAGGLGAKSVPPPTTPPTSPPPSSTYFSLFHSVPLLFFLTLLSLSAGFAQFLLLRALRTLPARIGARVLTVVLVALPVTLALGWAWAFGGSFWDDEEARVGGGWSTTGLRLISLVPLIAAILFSRMLYSQRNSLSRSLSVLELSSRIISLHPSLIFLSFSLLAGFLLLSIPILTIFSRLFLNGHFAKLTSQEKNGMIEWVWKTDLLARWMAYLTFSIWIWIWSIGRGIMRVTISGVVAHWYYEKGGNLNETYNPKDQQEEEEGDGSNSSESISAGNANGDGIGIGTGIGDIYSSDAGMMEEGSTSNDHGPSAPGAWDPPVQNRSFRPTSTGNPYSNGPFEISSIDLVRANFLKATGTSLGTVIQSSFFLTLSYLFLTVSSIARRLARMLITPGTPAFLSPLLHLATLLAGLSALVKGVSEYGLVYVGVTGESWRKSSKNAGRVVAKFGRKGALDGLIIHSLLSLSSLSLSFLTALAGFLYSAHTLHSPSDAPLIGLICGLVPWWTLRICGDVIGNAADTLYLCHALDLATNSPEVLNQNSAINIMEEDQDEEDGVGVGVGVGVGDDRKTPSRTSTTQTRTGTAAANRDQVRNAFEGTPASLPF